MTEPIARDRAEARGGDRARRPTRPRSRRCGSATWAARPSCRTCCAASPRSRPRSAPPPARPPTRRARRSRRRSSSAGRAARRGRARAASRAPTASTSRCRRTRRRPIGRLHLITQTRREIEDVFIGLGFNVAEGPEVETVYYNFDALNHAPTHPSRLMIDTFYVEPAHGHLRPVRAAAAHPHLADAGAGDGDASRRRCTSSCPGASTGPTPTPPTRPSSTRSRGSRSTPTSRSADLKGTLLAFARAIFGDEREVRLRPHFFPFTEPSVEVDVSCFNCSQGVTADGQRCALCKGTAWIEILGAGMVDPNVFEYVRELRLRPRAGPGVRVRDGDRADRDAQARRPRPAPALRQRRPLPGAVRLMRVPLEWLHEYCAPDLDTPRSPSAWR